MGVFDKVTDKQVSESQYFERGKYIMPGRYTVEVLKAKDGTTRPPANKGFFVAEMKVLESTDLEEHPIGSTATWMSTSDKDAFIGNVKHFVAACANMAIDDITKDDLIGAVGENNPLAGVILQVDAVMIQTKAGKDFTKVRFQFLANSLSELKSAPS